jgi:hypothetical protein
LQKQHPHLFYPHLHQHAPFCRLHRHPTLPLAASGVAVGGGVGGGGGPQCNGTSGGGRPGEHRYEKLWQCGDGDGSDGGSLDVNGCPSSPSPSNTINSTPGGTAENGWLSRYRLPSPCVTSDHVHHRHEPERGHAQWVDDGRGGEELTSDSSELLPCECLLGMAEPVRMVPSNWTFLSSQPPHSSGPGGERTEVKYTNPMFEGRGGHFSPPHNTHSPPFFSRLWGYMGLAKR